MDHSGYSSLRSQLTPLEHGGEQKGSALVQRAYAEDILKAMRLADIKAATLIITTAPGRAPMQVSCYPNHFSSR